MLQQRQKDASIFRHAFNGQMERWPLGYTNLTMKQEKKGMYWGVLEKRKRGKGLPSTQNNRNLKHSSIRAKQTT